MYVRTYDNISYDISYITCHELLYVSVPFPSLMLPRLHLLAASLCQTLTVWAPPRPE